MKFGVRIIATSLLMLTVAPALKATERDSGSKKSNSAPVSERYRFFRWLEDYSSVSQQQRRDNLLAKLKHIPLADSHNAPYLSLGGDYRLKAEASSNGRFAISRADSDYVLLNRLMVHADLQWTDSTRTFIQLGAYDENGRAGRPSPVEESALDLQQAFIDTRKGAFEARIGRQEVFLDSGKQLGIREGPNQRRSFDAVRIQHRPSEGVGIDAFIGREVQPKRASFEDSSSKGAIVWGIYGAKLAATNLGTLDAFYINVDRGGVVYNQGNGNEQRQTVGLRLTGQNRGLRYSYEGYYQFGDFNDDIDLQAWAIVTENYYQFSKHGWRPTLGLRANIASGDSDPNDGKLETFDALFPDLNYLTDAGVYTPRNLYELQALIDLFPSEPLKIRLRSNLLWRQNTNDAVYVSPGIPLVRGDASNERFIGYVLDAAITWMPSSNVSLSASYAFTSAGDVIKDAGGESTNYFVGSISFRF